MEIATKWSRRRSRSLRVFTAAVVTLGMSIGTTACSTATSATKHTSNVLTVEWASVERTGMQAAVAAFTKLHPADKIEVSYADVTPYQAEIRTQLSAGTAPDVFYVWPAKGNPGAVTVLAPAGYLANMSGESYVKSIPSSLAGAAGVGGKIYMVPMSFAGIGMMFNSATLAKSGLKVPDTYSGVLAFCKSAKAAGYIPFSLGAGETAAIMVPYALVADTVYRTDPTFDKKREAGKTTFSADPGFNSALNKEVQMNAAGCFGASPAGESLTDSVNEVASGKAIGSINITALFGAYQQAAPKVKLIFTPLPATDNPSNTMISGGPGAGPGINAKAKNKALAQEFVAYLASPAGERVYTNGAGELPAITKGYVAPSNLEKVVSFLSAGRVGPLLDQNWPNAQVQVALVQQVQLMLGGTATPKDVLAAMDQAYSK